MTFHLTPKDYRMKVSKRMKRLAFNSVLSQKAMDESIKVFEYFDFSTPKTRDMVDLLKKIGASEEKVLVLTEDVKKEAYLSGRNLPKVKVFPFKDVNTLEILHADILLIEDGVVEAIEAVERTR